MYEIPIYTPSLITQHKYNSCLTGPGGFFSREEVLLTQLGDHIGYWVLCNRNNGPRPLSMFPLSTSFLLFEEEGFFFFSYRYFFFNLEQKKIFFF